MPAAPVGGNANAPRIALTWYGAAPRGGPTLGDQFAVENLSEALSRKGIPHAVFSVLPLSVRAPVFDQTRGPPAIDLLVHVCGPLLPSPFLVHVMKLAKVRLAVGVSVLDRFDSFNDEFDAIVVRDGQKPETFDLAPARFAATPMPAAPANKVPVVGLCLRGHQGEYGPATIFHDRAADLFAGAIANGGWTSHTVNTLLMPENAENDIVSAFRRADIIATTRLHGAILGLAYGKPVVAIDQVEGGAKVASLLRRIGWPLVFRGDTVTERDVDEAFAAACTPEIHAVVARCRAEAIRLSAAAIDTSVRTIAAMSKMAAAQD